MVKNKKVKTQLMAFYRLHRQILPSLLCFIHHTSRISPCSLPLTSKMWPWESVFGNEMQTEVFVQILESFQLKVKPVLLKLSLFFSILWEWNLDVNLSILDPNQEII